MNWSVAIITFVLLAQAEQNVLTSNFKAMNKLFLVSIVNWSNIFKQNTR